MLANFLLSLHSTMQYIIYHGEKPLGTERIVELVCVLLECFGKMAIIFQFLGYTHIYTFHCYSLLYHFTLVMWMTIYYITAGTFDKDYIRCILY